MLFRSGKREKLEAAIDNLKGGMDQQVREVFAHTLTSGRINRWRSSLGMKPLNQSEAEILKEHIRFGNLDNALSEVSEGGMNMFTGNDFISRSENIVNQTGVANHALTVKNPEKTFVKKPGERAYTYQALGFEQDEASMYSWLMQISRYSNDELGGIAIANLDSPLVIEKMTDWMANTKQGQKFLADARLSNDMSAEEIARDRKSTRLNSSH